MRTDLFDFELPPELIAQRPAEPRDQARLLVISGELRDQCVRDLPVLLRSGDLLVLNDTKVIPSRLKGRRGEVPVEATLLKPLAPGHWQSLVRPARRLKPGDRIDFAPGLAAVVAAKNGDGFCSLAFEHDGDALLAALDRYGAMPLPPYIRRPAGSDDRDRQDYQTVFAQRPGAVAAPTAGLHFTPALLADLSRCGIGWTTVTLHVGAGTFLPVRSEQAEDHPMHGERGEVGAHAADAINRCRRAGGRIVAVGTTTLRLLETAAAGGGEVRPFTGETALFILPGFRFRVADLLLTNFHLPRSTLFMLVSAFAGLGRMKAAYAHAVAARYRFYSYGDACLIDRSDQG